jgi:hypothetical protein
VNGVTYNTGALIAGDRNDRAMWALHAGFLAEEVVVTVPSPVVAEAWRVGSRQANLSRLLAACQIEELTHVQAQAVGILAGKAGHDDIVDVTVVEGALRRRDAVVTSNATHIVAIADAVRARLSIATV